MEWIEVSICTTTEGIESVTATLLELGINGMEIEDDAEFRTFLESKQWDYIDDELLTMDVSANKAKIKIYVSANDYGRETLTSVENGIKELKSLDLGIDLGSLDVVTENVNDEDWVNIWKKYYKPFAIGEKLVIKPEWEEYENVENKIVFNSNPGHVFGTGLHQTTQLCIMQLENYVKEDISVLDLGCGSGILSIISLLLGAKNAYAIDIDPNAVKVAYENAALNQIFEDKYFVTYGDILKDEAVKSKVGNKKYDIAVANIIADVVIAFSEVVPQFLKEDGYFITSGIIKERLEDVYAGLSANGFVVENTFYKDDWVCIVSSLKKG